MLLSPSPTPATYLASAAVKKEKEKKRKKTVAYYGGLQETCRPGVLYFPLFPFLFVPGRYKVSLYRT